MSLRDIAVTIVVVGVLPFVLRHAYIGVLLWTWISVMNPHKLAWGFATNAPFAAMAAGVTLVSLLTTRDPVKFPASPTVAILAAFLVWVTITTVNAFHLDASYVQLQKVLKIQLMTLVALAVLHDMRHLQLFVWINVLSLGFYGVKGGIYTITTGGANRVWGPPGGFIEGNNEIGLALVMAIPLMQYLRLTSTSVWVRNGLLAAMLLSAAAVLGTHSRGAFLAIGAMAVFLWWRSPRKVFFGALVVTAAFVLLAAMPEHWVARMESIRNYQLDGSAMGRINAWWTMFNMANARLTGGGFQVYTPYVFNLFAPDPSIPRAAHSIYFQVLGEHGWIGLALFVGIFWSAWRVAGRLRKQARGTTQDDRLRHLAGMCQVSLVGYATGGAFLSLAYFDLPYNIVIMLLVAQRWFATQTAAVPAEQPAGVRSPLDARGQLSTK